MIKAIIFDLDNTLFPMADYGEAIFHSLYQLILNDGGFTGSIGEIKKDMVRKPFQLIAKKYAFSEQLVEKCTALLKELEYEGPLKTFPDYAAVKEITAEKFLVTAGFTRLQTSKIAALGIAQDFKEIHIVDNSISPGTKKEVFDDIAKRYQYKFSEVMVVGDDPDSEIKAAKELGMQAMLYNNKEESAPLSDLNELLKFF